MKTKTETILKYLPQYNDFKRDVSILPIQPNSCRYYGIGWLAGAEAAVDAILENNAWFTGRLIFSIASKMPSLICVITLRMKTSITLSSTAACLK